MTYVYDDVTYVVCALSARVTEGVPINNTLSLRLMMRHIDDDVTYKGLKEYQYTTHTLSRE